MATARIKKMIDAGRRFLLANPSALPAGRDTAHRMKLAVDDFTAAEHAIAIDELAIEFAKRLKAVTARS